jgi:GT2 family glycosyltransferase
MKPRLDGQQNMSKPRSGESNGLLVRISAWLRALNRRRLLRRRHAKHRTAERRWSAAEDPLNEHVARALHTRFAALEHPAVISIVMRGPVHDSMPGWPWQRGPSLTPNWHLVAPTGDALSDLARTVQTAPSEVVVLLPAGHALAPHASMVIAEAVAAFPGFALVYGDEDCIDAKGVRHSPLLHCNWNAELLRSTPYLSGLVVARRSALLALDLQTFEDSATGWWDLLLRLTEHAAEADVVHIPHVLSHRIAAQRVSREGAVPRATAGDVEAVRAHLARSGVAATTEAAAAGGVHVRYAVPAPAPLVSLIIPTRDGLHLLRQCVCSVLERTTYGQYEIVIVDNGSKQADTLRYLTEVSCDPRIRVHRDDRPFNFAALNNAAVPLCRGRVVGFLNNDVEVITPGWLEEMVGLAMRADVGAVGARLWFSNATLQHAGVILGIGGAAVHIHHRLTREQPGYLGRAHVTQEFSAVTAACMLMRRDVFDRVQGFDEASFAVDFNDIDLCLRVRRAGLRVLWTPHAELFHHESATRGANQSDEQKTRHARECQRMRERWPRWLDNDPAYNPNASLRNIDFAFSIATEPRVSLLRPWFDQLP